jgi:hypothetical protein
MAQPTGFEINPEAARVIAPTPMVSTPASKTSLRISISPFLCG